MACTEDNLPQHATVVSASGRHLRACDRKQRGCRRHQQAFLVESQRGRFMHNKTRRIALLREIIIKTQPAIGN